MHVSSPCTDPDWNGTVTEQTSIHLVVSSDFEGAIFILISVFIYCKAAFLKGYSAVIYLN